MAKSLFQLSLESEEVVVPAEPITPEEVVERQELNEEVKEQEAELVESAVTLEEGSEVMGELEDQLADNEAKLEESPESITEDDVQIAQEKYYIAITKLDQNYVDVNHNRIAIESDGSPIEKMRVLNDNIRISHEGILEAWTKFKLNFTYNVDKYIVSKTKQIENHIKTIDGLIEKAGSVKELPSKDLSNILYSNFGGFIVANNHNYDISQFVKYFDSVPKDPIYVAMKTLYGDTKFTNLEGIKSMTEAGLVKHLTQIADTIGKEFEKNPLLKVAKQEAVKNSRGFWKQIFTGLNPNTISAVYAIDGRRLCILKADFVEADGWASGFFKHTTVGSSLSKGGFLFGKVIGSFSTSVVNISKQSALKPINYSIKTGSDIVRDLTLAKQLAKTAGKHLQDVRANYYKLIDEANKQAGSAGFFQKQESRASSGVIRKLTQSLEDSLFEQAYSIESVVSGVVRVSNEALK